ATSVDPQGPLLHGNLRVSIHAEPVTQGSGERPEAVAVLDEYGGLVVRVGDIALPAPHGEGELFADLLALLPAVPEPGPHHPDKGLAVVLEGLGVEQEKPTIAGPDQVDVLGGPADVAGAEPGSVLVALAGPPLRPVLGGRVAGDRPSLGREREDRQVPAVQLGAKPP